MSLWNWQFTNNARSADKKLKRPISPMVPHLEGKFSEALALATFRASRLRPKRTLGLWSWRGQPRDENHHCAISQTPWLSRSNRAGSPVAVWMAAASASLFLGA
jgi:hypothetical protein